MTGTRPGISASEQMIEEDISMPKGSRESMVFRDRRRLLSQCHFAASEFFLYYLSNLSND